MGTLWPSTTMLASPPGGWAASPLARLSSCCVYAPGFVANMVDSYGLTWISREVRRGPVAGPATASWIGGRQLRAIGDRHRSIFLGEPSRPGGRRSVGGAALQRRSPTAFMPHDAPVMPHHAAFM